MPTHKKIVINGVEVPPIEKKKLPPKTDWQAKILEKRAEDALAEATEAQDES